VKIDARRVEGFLRDPVGCRVVLLYGDDAGLIRERAGILVRSAAGSLDDPFRVADLGRDGHSRIFAEVSSAPLTGGRRVVRVRDVGEALAKIIETVLAAKAIDGLLVLEAEGLAARGKLRGLVERAELGAAIGCYGLSGDALERLIRETLAATKAGADDDAVRWLSGQLGGDLGVTRREIEKLALFVGVGGHVDMEAAQACVGDLAGLSLDDALFAATAGDTAATDRALELAVADGAAPVAVLRASLLHLQRLQRARAAMGSGMSASDAAKQARPPVFFQRSAAFQQALRLWSEQSLQAACARIWDSERLCKQTGTPAEVICRSAVLGLAQRAASARRSLRQ
jgi:DNA polymerase-3 subunit delta